MESSLLKLATLALAAAWAVLVLIGITGHLAWHNRLLWLPVALFAISFFLAMGSWEYEQNRAPVVAVAAGAFGSMLIYAVGYVFLFGLVGH